MPDRTALLLGATGLVGGHTLRLLAHDDRWSRVVTLGRRPLAAASPMHEDHVVDFSRLVDYADLFASDDVFCCLGTTMAKAGSKDAFRHVDLEIPFMAAQLARSAGATQMLLVSALGAKPDARLFYNRIKGQAEEAVKKAAFEALQIFRPSLLTGERDEVRRGEQVGEAILTRLRPLLVGPLARLQPTPAEAVARALVEVSALRPYGVHVFEPADIKHEAERSARPALGAATPATYGGRPNVP